jgi:tetratricopeptide (TPR) repeat protein
MNRRLLFILVFIAAMPSTAQRLRAQNPPVSSFAESREPEQANPREDGLYNEAKDALDNGDYDQAVSKFDEVAKMRGRKADAALYFKAYALSKAGNKSQALATIAELGKAYPQSKWKKDADVLETELKETANPAGLTNEEDQIVAFTALMNSDPERGLTFARTWLQGNASTRKKDKVLFVLATQGGEKAQDVLLTVAKSSNDPDLQKRAIKYVGMTGNSRSRAALKEIYQASTDVSVKKAIFQGWLMCGCKEEVLAVANTERSPELRREAIRYLGMMGGRSELRTIYKSSTDAETRAAVINGMLMSGDTQGLIEIATTEKDPDVLDKAINTLGMVGGEGSLTALTNIYNSHNDLPTKKRVINAMFLHGAAKEMVALARKETNPELHKAWMQKLSLMSSPEITEYMMEILNK